MDFVFVIVACLIVGFSKGGLGQVLGVLIAPLLAQVMPVSEAISLALPLLLIGDAIALRVYWKTWDIRYIRIMIPGAAIGIALGTALLTQLPDQTLRHILGILTLVYVVYRLFDRYLQIPNYQHRNWHGVLAGAATGFTSALANVGAPPFTAYLLLQNVTPLVFTGTATLFFAINNLLKLGGFVAAGLFDVHRMIEIAWALPLIPLSIWISKKIISRIDQKQFDRLMIGCLFFIALFLLFVPSTR